MNKEHRKCSKLGQEDLRVAAIRFNGMASGLPPNIVEQIMEAERIPVKNLEVKKNKEEDTLKLVTDLESKVSGITKNITELMGTRGFTDNKLLSGDPNIIDGTVDPQAVVNGEYNIEVLQLAQKPSAISNGFPDRDHTELGVGYMKFETPEGTKEVYISGANSTLDGVAAQINAANVGLRATIIQDRKEKENPFRLIVSGLATGDDQQVNFPNIYLLDGDQDMYFDETRPAQNAKIKLDGFEIELPSNTVDDIIPGVTLNLKQAAPGREIRMSVKEDLEVISGKIKSFVDSYNEALTFIQNQHKLQKGSDGKQKLGPLGGDSLVRSVESALRRVILSPQYGVETPITRIGELGIEFNRNGTLNFNQERFTKTLNSNPKAVSAFLRGDGFQTGFIPTLKREISNIMAQPFGVIGNRKKGIQDKIDQMNKRIDDKERQLSKKEDSLRTKFANLEQQMSKLQSQGGAFAAMQAGQKQGS